MRNKLVTLRVDFVGDAGDGVHAFDIDTQRFYLPSRLIVSVEDAPLALPTEPGTRFWGKTNQTEPQWWFVQLWHGEVTYCPTFNGEGASGDLYEAVAQQCGLVRLPDPEETP